LVFRSGVALDRKLLEHAKALKLIIRAGSGMDSLDVEYAESRNILIKRIPEPAARAVAEMGLGLMLCLARKIIPADKAFRQGHWAKNEIEGRLLAGKALGVVGVGNIGSVVGQLGKAMGMRVIGCVEYPSPDRSERLREKGIELLSFSDVIEEADFLSIHVPLQASTRGLINGVVLSRMKVGSCLINLSRGGVVDEQALFQSLSNERGLMGAAVDVHQSEGAGFSSPLSSLSNVILTPHIGSQTIDTQQEIGKRVVEIIDAFSGG
jgi:phosphoglycerate dehydrogenase-like enzyme